MLWDYFHSHFWKDDLNALFSKLQSLWDFSVGTDLSEKEFCDSCACTVHSWHYEAIKHLEMEQKDFCSPGNLASVRIKNQARSLFLSFSV